MDEQLEQLWLAIRQAMETVSVFVDASFDAILHADFVGVARWAAGQADGDALVAAAIEALEQGAAADQDRENDALFYRDQLRHVQRQYVTP